MCPTKFLGILKCLNGTSRGSNKSFSFFLTIGSSQPKKSKFFSTIFPFSIFLHSQARKWFSILKVSVIIQADRVAKATNVLFIMMKSWVSHCTLSSFYFCHQGLLTWDFKVLQVGLGLFIIKVIFQEKANYRFTRGATLKTLFRTFELQSVCSPQ